MGFAIVNQFGLGDYVPEWIVVCFGKTNLGILRLLHFLAIAIVINQLIPSDWAPLTGRVLHPFILCGQHSLEIFSLGVTLAFAGYVVIVGNSDSSMARFLVTVAGTVTMVAVAALMSWYKSTRVSFRVVDRRLPARALGDAGPVPGMPVRAPSPAAVAPSPHG